MKAWYQGKLKVQSPENEETAAKATSEHGCVSNKMMEAQKT
jgi:hypothetical protein